MVTLHSATAPELFPKTVFWFRRSWLHCTVLLGYYPIFFLQRQFFIQEIMVTLHSATRLLLDFFPKDMFFFDSGDHGYIAQCLPESRGSLLSSCLATASSVERTLKTSNQSNFVGCLLCICFWPDFPFVACKMPSSAMAARMSSLCDEFCDYSELYRHRCVSCSVLRTLNQTDFQCL